ncbi:hypothetical protein GUJ93_ZPchr0003g17308 [Zizania palustris]|uniref:Uncharacterized protein n=1 Tax=Zizania palustris TaxID=103762 RepID=A0A8J5RQL4_ZIZPA|nr:hypothetical protein GUJ93_ZPchr0003g17308 [Zizania palustris]
MIKAEEKELEFIPLLVRRAKQAQEFILTQKNLIQCVEMQKQTRLIRGIRIRVLYKKVNSHGQQHDVCLLLSLFSSRCNFYRNWELTDSFFKCVNNIITDLSPYISQSGDFAIKSRRCNNGLGNMIGSSLPD